MIKGRQILKRRLTNYKPTEDDEKYLAKMTPQQRLIEEAIQILKIPSDEDRTPQQIDTLRAALQVNLQKMQLGKGKELVNIALQRLQHKCYSANDAVFHIGEIVESFSFYMILRGSVGVFVKLPQKHSEGELRQFELTEINCLHAGENFGELAILNDETRSATIICKEKTDFAVLTAEDFKQVTAARTEWGVNKNVKFLQQSMLMQDLSARLILTMIYQIKILRLKRNQLLFKEGDQPTHIYIIKKGEIALQKEIDIKIDEDIFHHIDDIFKPKQSVKKKVEMAILGPKESFGEEEVFLNKMRQVSAICHSGSAKVFAIDLSSKESCCLQLS